ncbi:hypothetical protein NLJ89_g8069 [Agrocybe chaxingu]|uniref:Major facilitator superfamily (MFS) profile domain-containing protein n=1 Tax=Agrocybe chaxingu TaxID=84603 RepID=A0A9W8JVL7_9AGAR|nr:hypothetical protein NLJ89_g8069 [Agrocybe chaxingu]
MAINVIGEKENQTEHSTETPTPTLVKEHEFTTDFGFIPIPPRLRYDPEKPPHFGILLNVAFGFASTFIVSNLYYCQPLLIQLSIAFGVSYGDVSRIPTLVQAGYATGLVLISPLGDLVRRRQLIICIVAISTSLTIGLAVTGSLKVFEALSFLVGAVSVTPQILIPLAADLAPPHRRASAIAVVLSGLLFGILVARVLSGIIAEFASYRVVYYYALGVQSLVLVGSYFLLPDYPSKNIDLTYFKILWTMAKFAVTEPVLIQGCLIIFSMSACFSNFWVTLTFLLGGPPYNYSTLVIGLFGLVGMLGVSLGPLVGRLIDRLVPCVGAIIIATFGLDIFTQMLQVSVSTTIFSINPAARARLNAVAILSIFIGQVMGTAVGTNVFINHGWRAGAGLSMGLFGLSLLFLLGRGPHCRQYTWIGYEGGLEARKSVVQQRVRLEEEREKQPESLARGEDEKVLRTA